MHPKLRYAQVAGDDLCAVDEPALQEEENRCEFLKSAAISDLYHRAAERVGRCLAPRRLLEGAVPTGKRLGYAGYDTRRALYGVVAWIVVLLAGYWIVADWHSLPQLANALLTSVR
jgi:hypothetical protein